jgi:hypothetical protein
MLRERRRWKTQQSHLLSSRVNALCIAEFLPGAYIFFWQPPGWIDKSKAAKFSIG